MKRLLVSVFFLLISLSAVSQNKLDAYKYVIVSKKFDFLNKEDQYQTSSLTKFLLNKKGFKAFLSSEKSLKEIKVNRCKFLFVNVVNRSSFFTTRNSIEFKDCNGALVYKSIEGKSKLKDYKKGYHQAIRNAFKDPLIVNYSYTPKLEQKTDIIDKESPIFDKKIVKEVDKTLLNTTVLYAQPKENGFQLIDTTPKVVYTLLKTNTPNLFILKNIDGVLYLKDSKWIAEYYKNNQLIKEELQIKF